MAEFNNSSKKLKEMPTAEDIKGFIMKSDEPFIIKNVLSWDLLHWTADEWVTHLGNEKVDLRFGTKHCTKVPQWENRCEVVTATLKDVFDNVKQENSGTWMYFDYKHIEHHFKMNSTLFESVSWADFGFPEKDGKDSTIWIGTQGAYTPCHMDSYGCNIVAQVYGRKLWLLFPPSKTALLKATRVPYEESSVYSDIHFSCGLNITKDLVQAFVVELHPGDVLVVPKHWWHYVENLTTAISINTWIPLESDHVSRLNEAIVRFFVTSMLKTLSIEKAAHLLNPNEMDLVDEPVDLRQLSLCIDQVLKQADSNKKESFISSTDPLTTQSCVSVVPTMSVDDLQEMMLKKCGCVRDCDDGNRKSDQLSISKLSIEHMINAFCHSDVIAKVSEIIVTTRKL